MTRYLKSPYSAFIFALALCLLILGQSVYSDKSALPGLISVKQAQLLASAGEVVLVDIRSEKEWLHTGVAPSAETISMHQQGGKDAFVQELTALLDGDKSRPVALICAAGVRSDRMQKYLQKQGFTQVTNVEEGMEGSWFKKGWIEQDLPIINYNKQ